MPILRRKAVADPGFLAADVIIDGQLSPDEEELIIAALAALRVSAQVRIRPRLRGASDLQWLVLAALPLQAFLTSIGGKVADDAYTAFQNAVRKILRREPDAEKPAPRPIVLQDATTGLQVILDHDLPPEGYQQLLSLDLSKFRVGPVQFDRLQQRWRSELDEAIPPPKQSPQASRSTSIKPAGKQCVELPLCVEVALSFGGRAYTKRSLHTLSSSCASSVLIGP
jgi:hypothetical protein